ncbi:MAG: SDR family oxidoreductase [Candidatus Kapabacteria bacterium]|nr:SDR family oxidoreductase [Ignavibacteriota bacterium]MCW5884267.1 SDR family oxidoreductase [Candidatus Kapabacteria bacterium]
MDKKVLVLVGANSAIGKEVAEILKNDYDIITLSRSDNPIAFAKEHINWSAETTDTIKLSEVIDGLVYLPGTINLRPFNRIKDEEFLNDININFLGAVRIIRQALPGLLKSPIASVVGISTVAVKTGMSFHSSISSAKGALESLIRSLAAEYAGKIRFNGVAPSLTDTPLSAKLLSTDEKKANLAKNNPMNMIGQPKDIAEAVAFLITEKSKWVTGQIISVDGGMGIIK